MTRVGESLAPAAREITQALTVAVNFVTELIDKMGPLGDIVVQLAGGFAAWKIVSTVYHYASLLVQLPFAKIGIHLAESAAQAALAGQSAGALTTTLQAAGTASSMLGSVWSTIAGPLGVLVTLAAALYMNWEKVSEWATKAGQAIQSIDRSTPTAKLKPATQDYHIRQMESAFGLPPEIAHAEGGILTRPHVGLVAEAGPEAIIPLSKPQLGIPLLERAASILGLRVSDPTDGKSEISSNHTPRVLSSSLSTSIDSLFPTSLRSISSNILGNNLSGISRGGKSSASSNPAGSLLRISKNFSSPIVPENSGTVPDFLSNSISSVKSTVSGAITRVNDFMSSLKSEASSYVSSVLSTFTSAVNSAESYLLSKAGDTFGLQSNSSSLVRNSSVLAAPNRQAPVINITVNSSGQDGRSLAEDIASKVREVLMEISSMEERVSYA